MSNRFDELDKIFEEPFEGPLGEGFAVEPDGALFRRMSTGLATLAA